MPPFGFGATPILGSSFASASFQGDAVQDTAALTALLPEQRFDKQERFVEGPPKEEYHFDLQSAAASNPPEILVPDDSPATGRWFRHIPSGGVPGVHALGGAEHSADTFANLDGKVSDGGLVITVESGTDQIQGAIDALPSSGGIVRLKEGSHVIATTVLVNKSDIVIEGPRAAKVTTTIAATDKVLFQITTGTNRVTIRGFAIEVPDIGNVGSVVEAPGASNEVTIDDLRIESTSALFKGFGIRSIGICNDWIIRNCFIKGRFSATGCIFQQNASSLRMLVNKCVIIIGDNTGGRGIAVFGSQSIISNCIVVSVAQGISIEGNTILVDNCIFIDVTSRGINTSSGSNKNTIKGCHVQIVSTGSCTGILAAGADSSISGCTIDGNGNADASTDAIQVDSNGARCKISDCKIFGLGAARSGIIVLAIDVKIGNCELSDCGCPGIVLFSAAAQFADVEGNKIKACTNGVETAADDGLIAANHFRGNTGTEILETGSADNNRIEGNHLAGGGTITTVGINTTVQELESGPITTTDATVTTIATIPILDDSVVLVEVNVTARRTDVPGNATYVRRANISREAAAAAVIQGSVDTPHTRESSGNAPWDATIVVSGNNALVQVTGQAGKTVNWKASHELRRVS